MPAGVIAAAPRPAVPVSLRRLSSAAAAFAAIPEHHWPLYAVNRVDGKGYLILYSDKAGNAYIVSEGPTFWPMIASGDIIKSGQLVHQDETGRKYVVNQSFVKSIRPSTPFSLFSPKQVEGYLRALRSFFGRTASIASVRGTILEKYIGSMVG